jgi:hypothetical protein
MLNRPFIFTSNIAQHIFTVLLPGTVERHPMKFREKSF